MSHFERLSDRRCKDYKRLWSALQLCHSRSRSYMERRTVSWAGAAYFLLWKFLSTCKRKTLWNHSISTDFFRNLRLSELHPLPVLGRYPPLEVCALLFWSSDFLYTSSSLTKTRTSSSSRFNVYWWRLSFFIVILLSLFSSPIKTRTVFPFSVTLRWKSSGGHARCWSVRS